eukprot:gene19289-21214_t
MKFDYLTVRHYLYGYQQMRIVALDELSKDVEIASAQRKQDEGWSNKNVIKFEQDQDLTKMTSSYSNRIRLADGIALCFSSIPGEKYGACSTRNIPAGTWFGPFEGKLVRTNDDFEGKSSEFMWEIFHNGKVSHFLDGQSRSSWMSFVRCARHKSEQNMVVFQYHGCIYYRTVKDIQSCAELLVWYDNKYTQLLDVNGKRKTAGKTPNKDGRKRRRGSLREESLVNYTSEMGASDLHYPKACEDAVKQSCDNGCQNKCRSVLSSGGEIVDINNTSRSIYHLDLVGSSDESIFLCDNHTCAEKNYPADWRSRGLQCGEHVQNPTDDKVVARANSNLQYAHVHPHYTHEYPTTAAVNLYSSRSTFMHHPCIDKERKFAQYREQQK